MGFTDMDPLFYHCFYVLFMQMFVYTRELSISRDRDGKMDAPIIVSVRTE